jgi:hypothetical protein
MWFSTARRYLKENEAMEAAIQAGCTAIHAARVAGTPETDLRAIGDAAVQAYHIAHSVGSDDVTRWHRRMIDRKNARPAKGRRVK